MKTKIVNIIYAAIDDLNSQRSEGERLKKTEDTVLFGQRGTLDSLGLVNLIVGLEQAVNDTLNIDITLADERAMSLENSPFRTVTILADYILLLIEEKKIGP